MSVGKGVAVSLGAGVSTGAAVSDGKLVSVGRVGELVGTGEEQETRKKIQRNENKILVATGECMQGILTDMCS